MKKSFKCAIVICFILKEKFDIALSRIGDEIDKDQKEQDEMQFS